MSSDFLTLNFTRFIVMDRKLFDTLVDAYDADNSIENLDAIKNFLKKHIIYFAKYYNNAKENFL